MYHKKTEVKLVQMILPFEDKLWKFDDWHWIGK